MRSVYGLTHITTAMKLIFLSIRTDGEKYFAICSILLSYLKNIFTVYKKIYFTVKYYLNEILSRYFLVSSVECIDYNIEHCTMCRSCSADKMSSLCLVRISLQVLTPVNSISLSSSLPCAIEMYEYEVIQ